MVDFINLNEDNLEFIEDAKVKKIPKIANKVNLELLENPNKEALEELHIIENRKDEKDKEDHVYVKNCEADLYYGDTDDNGAFLKENLFSELTDDYQREIARLNLGIATKYALLWGNITGNLLQQEDLVKFVLEHLTDNTDKLIEELNTKLSAWAKDVNELLNSKVSADSPNFTGTPTAPTPGLEENSNRIPTTEWVKALLLGTLESTNLQAFNISSDSHYIDENIEVVLSWEYLNPVDKQWLNDVELNPTLRSSKFSNITLDKSFTLKWEFEGKLYARTLYHKVIKPYYFGIDLYYLNCEKTKSNRVCVETGKGLYIHIIVPKEFNARLEVSGIEGGFTIVGYTYINSIKYLVYKSDHDNLGITYINIIT